MILNVSYNVFKDAAELNYIYYFLYDGKVLASTGFEGTVFQTNIYDPADITDFNNVYLAGAIQVFQEDDLIARVLLETKSMSLYDVGNTYTYIGTAPIGSSPAAAVWKIKRFEFDVSGNPINQKVSTIGVIWDDRVTATYY